MRASWARPGKLRETERVFIGCKKPDARSPMQEGGYMTSHGRILSAIFSVVLLSSACYGATITGTVKGTDGVAFQGAFVEAQNTQTRMTFIALSDTQGHYRVENVAAGDYRVGIRAPGYRADAQTGVKLAAGQDSSLDFSLQKGVVRWSDISIYQADKLWPAAPAKDKIFDTCFTCHGFQTRMAAVTRDADGWQDRVAFMRTAMKFGLEDQVTDPEADMIAAYLTKLFGPDSVLPKSPADMPEYKDTLRPLSSNAMNIEYVEYDMPGPSRMPFSAAPGKDGYLWIPNFGVANKITRLDPKTGATEDFAVPNIGTAAIHSAVEAPDGKVWLTEQGSDKLGVWDPQTKTITEYQDRRIPGKLGYAAGSKHTLRFDADGNVWFSGRPLGKFDPKTNEYTDSPEVHASYDVKEDQNGNIWFTKQDTNQFGMIDTKTMKVSIYTPLTKNSFPRRLEIDPSGIVWSGEFRGGKLLRFDPKTQEVKEFDLPGPQPTPYGLGVDTKGNIWYASYNMDVIGCFDPQTEKIVEYPFPHSENTIREFFRDADGRLWYGTPSNNKVGYFYLKGSPASSARAGK
jgi:virginiamycin B lyase